MEKADIWDSSTVILTSDHPFREAQQLDGKADWKIPYMLKFSGQKEGFLYTKPFNAVLTADLALAILRGEVRDAPATVQWLDANRSRVPMD